jgi:transcriptional regulator with XRE-family HTH domain
MMASFPASAATIATQQEPAGDRITKITPQTIGHNIRFLRRAVGMSLRDMGEALGVSLVQFQRYETGASQISVVRLLAISTVLGVEIGSFFGEPVAPERDRLGGKRRQEDRELARLFATLSESSDRRTILHLARAAASRDELFQSYGESARQECDS